MVYLGLAVSGTNRYGTRYPKALYGLAPYFSSFTTQLITCSFLVYERRTYTNTLPPPLRSTISVLRHCIWNNGETISI